MSPSGVSSLSAAKRAAGPSTTAPAPRRRTSRRETMGSPCLSMSRSSAGQFPEPDGLVEAAGQGALAVGREGGAVDLRGVALEAALVAGLQVVDVDHRVGAAGQGELAVRRE